MGRGGERMGRGVKPVGAWVGGRGECKFRH